MAQEIIVVGDWILDRTVETTVRGVSPEDDRTLVLTEACGEKHNPGGAANVAANLRSLGADVALVGAAGEDSSGKALLKQLYDRDIGYFCHHHTGVTCTKTRYYTPSGLAFRVDREPEGPITGLGGSQWHQSAVHKDLRVALLPVLEDRETHVPPAVCLANYDKGFLTPTVIASIMRMTSTSLTLVDPGRDPWELYAREKVKTLIFKVNIRQALAFCTSSNRNFGMALDPHHVYDRNVYIDLLHLTLLAADRRNAGLDYLCITLGAGGVVVGGKDMTTAVVPHARKIPVVDVCGAGDTFMAVLAHELAPLAAIEASDVRNAADTANYAAGRVVQKRGVSTVTKEDLLEQ